MSTETPCTCKVCRACRQRELRKYRRRYLCAVAWGADQEVINKHFDSYLEQIRTRRFNSVQGQPRTDVAKKRREREILLVMRSEIYRKTYKAPLFITGEKKEL